MAAFFTYGILVEERTYNTCLWSHSMSQSVNLCYV